MLIKIVSRLKYGSDQSWDAVCLVHNIISVIVGAVAIATWERPREASCGSLSDTMAAALMLQTVHCVSDFLVYLDEMIAQPVFIFHHAVLLVVSCIQPHCAGCFYLVWAYAIAEFGSAAIALDAQWRKQGALPVLYCDILSEFHDLLLLLLQAGRRQVWGG